MVDATTIKMPGLAYHLVVPGMGAVIVNAGYVYIDPTGFVIHGHHPVNWFWWTGAGDFSRLCAAMQ